MDIELELLEPLKYYEYDLKQKHYDTLNTYFDDLVIKSGIDIEANRTTCKSYYSEMAHVNTVNGKLNGNKSVRGLLIAGTIVSFIAGTIMILLSALKITTYPQIFVPIGIVLVLLGIFFIILNCTVVAKKMTGLNNELGIHQRKAEELKSIANSQLAPLNALYDWNINSRLISKTCPIIRLDDNFNIIRYAHLMNNYGHVPHDEHTTTLFVQSGQIVGNPFIYERYYYQYMYDKTYVGSITIHWVTTHTDSKGRTYTVSHSQTLTAEVIEPAAGFARSTRLVYGNEAAPQLSFSRDASNANSMNEKDLEKFTAKFEKKLIKMQEEAIKNHKNFTPLGNAKFEGLFGALDRTNEVEFRLLFTPLAQKNLLGLMTSKKPYGDDFSFRKKGMVNIIKSSHAQSASFDGNPYHFYDFDYDNAKQKFLDYNMKMFQDIYYDLAPLLSIPLYQQHRDFDEISKKGHYTNTSIYEAEVLSNFMDEDIFKPENCDTEIILKATPTASYGKVDIFNIHSYGFQKIPHVSYFEKLGGDGHYHTVPVHWFEYIEVHKDVPIAVISLGGSKQDYLKNYDRISEVISTYSMSSDIIYQRGLLSFALSSPELNIKADELIKMFSHKED